MTKTRTKWLLLCNTWLHGRSLWECILLVSTPQTSVRPTWWPFECFLAHLLQISFIFVGELGDANPLLEDTPESLNWLLASSVAALPGRHPCLHWCLDSQKRMWTQTGWSRAHHAMIRQTSTSNNNLCVEESESEEKQDHTLTTFKYQFCLCCMYMNCSVTFQCWYMVLTISVDKTKWLCSTFCRQYDLRHLYPSLCYVCTGRLHCNSVKSFWQMTLVFFLGGQSFTQVLK